jgi:hypothetical protein
MIEVFGFQQHRCENLKPRTKLSHLKLNFRISKPVMKKPVIFQFLALEFKNGPLNEGLILEVKDQLLSLIVVVLYSVALSNALCSLVKTPLVFQGEDVVCSTRWIYLNYKCASL